MTTGRLLTLVSLLSLGVPSSSYAQPESGASSLTPAEEYLRAYRSYEEQFLADFDLEATEMRPKLMGQDAIISSLELSANAGVRAWRVKLESLPKISHLSETSLPEYTYVTHDDEEVMQFWVDQEACGYKSSNENTYAKLIRSHYIAAEGELQFEEKQWAVVYAHPSTEARRTMVWYNQTLLALGRGFSQFIESVEGIEQNEDGLVTLKTRTQKMLHNWGDMTLVVDTNAGYLVRRATFLKDGLEEPRVYESEGTYGEGRLRIAERGSIRSQGRDMNITHVDVYSLQPFSAKKLASIKQDFVRISNWPDRTVVDQSRGPGKATTALIQDGKVIHRGSVVDREAFEEGEDPSPKPTAKTADLVSFDYIIVSYEGAAHRGDSVSISKEEAGVVAGNVRNALAAHELTFESAARKFGVAVEHRALKDVDPTALVYNNLSHVASQLGNGTLSEVIETPSGYVILRKH